MDPEKVLKEIQEYAKPIYDLGEKNENGVIQVGVQHILKRYKGKPDQAANVIFKALDVFDDVISVINQLKKANSELKKENSELCKEKSASQIAEITGKKILQYVSENINENSSSLASSAQKLKSYAEVLESKKSEVSTLIENKDVKYTSGTSVNTIKYAVRDVIRETKSREDRSKNIIIFGLEEVETADIMCSVESLLNAIEQKSDCPSAVVNYAECIGEPTPGKIRPVRVIVKEKFMVHDAMRYSKLLREIEKYRNVYISIDRTYEQQKEHKKLVTQMKSNMRDHPEKYWFIKNGNISSRQRI